MRVFKLKSGKLKLQIEETENIVLFEKGDTGRYLCHRPLSEL